MSWYYLFRYGSDETKKLSDMFPYILVDLVIIFMLWLSLVALSYN